MSDLVLSIFPGIDLLGRAFENEGFCVVRGPDLLWGGDIKNYVGRVFEKYRKLREYSQSDFAGKNKIRQDNYCQYEKGVKRPDIERLEKIAGNLGLVPLYMLPKMPKISKASDSKFKTSISHVDRLISSDSPDRNQIISTIGNLEQFILKRKMLIVKYYENL